MELPKILCWYDLDGQSSLTLDDVQAPFLTETQRTEAEYKRAEAEGGKAPQMVDYFRLLGLDPDHLPPPP